MNLSQSRKTDACLFTCPTHTPRTRSKKAPFQRRDQATQQQQRTREPHSTRAPPRKEDAHHRPSDHGSPGAKERASRGTEKPHTRLLSSSIKRERERREIALPCTPSLSSTSSTSTSYRYVSGTRETYRLHRCDRLALLLGRLIPVALVASAHR